MKKRVYHCRLFDESGTVYNGMHDLAEGNHRARVGVLSWSNVSPEATEAVVDNFIGIRI